MQEIGLYLTNSSLLDEIYSRRIVIADSSREYLSPLSNKVLIPVDYNWRRVEVVMFKDSMVKLCKR